MIKNTNYRILTFLWAILILVLSITPGDYVPKVEFEILSPDTLAHFVFYMVLIYLRLKWRKVNLTSYLNLSLILLTTISYGYGIEVIQGGFIPGRYYDIYDVAFNSIGAVVGVGVYFLFKKK